MSQAANRLKEEIERIRCEDSTFTYLSFTNTLPGTITSELFDCLLAHPNVVEYVCLGGNQLSDEPGAKLAQCVAISSTITCLSLHYNKFGPPTYLKLAIALRVNTSLHVLHLTNNLVEDTSRIDAAFIETLQLNPHRPPGTKLFLYDWRRNEFKRLRFLAQHLGAPSMLSQLGACDSWHEKK